MRQWTARHVWHKMRTGGEMLSSVLISIISNMLANISLKDLKHQGCLKLRSSTRGLMISATHVLSESSLMSVWHGYKYNYIIQITYSFSVIKNIYFFIILAAGHKLSPSFSVLHCRLQISTSLSCMMNTGPGLASKLLEMSQIMLVSGPPLIFRFFFSHSREHLHFEQMDVKTDFSWQSHHTHHSTQWSSNIQLEEQKDENTLFDWREF